MIPDWPMVVLLVLYFGAAGILLFRHRQIRDWLARQQGLMYYQYADAQLAELCHVVQGLPLEQRAQLVRAALGGRVTFQIEAGSRAMRLTAAVSTDLDADELLRSDRSVG